MPYIIYVPGTPRPYITNDPRIYLDCCHSFGWSCESRPFSDPYCREALAAENMRHKSGRRREQLTQLWEAELERRARLMAVEGESVQLGVVEVFEEPAAIANACGNQANAKRDSVLSVVVEVREVMEEEEGYAQEAEDVLPP